MKIYKPIISKGLINCGNSCFFNSVIQMLYSMDDLRDEIMEINSKNSVINALKNMFILLSNEKKKFVSEENIIPYYKTLYRFITKENFGEQQDATELLMFICKQIESETNLGNIYLTELIQESYCLNNNKQSKIEMSNPVKDSIIVLNLHGGNTLKKLIEYYTKEEQLDSPLSRCNNGLKSIKKMNIKIPDENNYLFIQLNRSGVFGNKNMNKSKIIIEKSIIIDNVEYILVGAILKNGSKKGGHYIYTTYTDGKLFRTYNDSRVLEKKHGNMTLENNAYLLLYKRTDHRNNQSVIPNNSNSKIPTKNNNLKKKLKLVNENITRNLVLKEKLLMEEKKRINLKAQKEKKSIQEKLKKVKIQESIQENIKKKLRNEVIRNNPKITSKQLKEMELINNNNQNTQYNQNIAKLVQNLYNNGYDNNNINKLLDNMRKTKPKN